MRSLRLTSIRSKLLALTAGAAIGAQLIAGALSAWRAAELYAQQKSQSLLATAQVLAAAAARPAASADADGVYGALRAAGKIPGVSFVEVLTLDGQTLADLGAAGSLETDLSISPAAPALPLRALLTSRTIEVAAPIVQAGREVGALRLFADTKDLPAQLWSAVADSAIGGVVSLVVALALVLRLQQGVTGPLRGLTTTIRRIKDTHDYSASLASQSADEVGVLIAGFNTMIGDIRDRDRRLQAHLERLEQEVAERTQDYRAAAAEAQMANQAKSDFLATMSHEIRTPMNGILVMAELLAACDLPGRARRHADVIAKSGQSLLAIINDILDLSKIEAGRLEVESLDIDPVDAGETVLRLFGEKARAKGLDLAARAQLPPGALVVADPVRLGQVLSNLVNNALKFTESGSVTLEIAPEPADASRVRFAVIDTGIGIPADKLAAIFDAFSQADQTTTRRFGGTGLGLAIGKKLVAAMGGDLIVTSRVDKGSIFSFHLPLSKAAGSAVAPQNPSRGQKAVVRLAGAASAQSVGLYLADIGFEVSLVGDGASTAAAAAAELIVFDVQDLRGRARPGLAASGLVVAVADPADAAEDLLSRGIADFVLQTPISRADVYEIGQWLAAGRPARKHEALAQSTQLPRFAGARVLVADDSQVNQEVAQAALAQLGIVAALVDNGQQAVEALAAGGVDLILMDGSMPVMDGFEAALAIRAIEKREGRARTPIIALTAHVVGAAAEQWRACDMDGVLHKPYTLAKLAEIIAPHLRPADRLLPAPPSASPEPLEDKPPALLNLAALEGLRAMSGDPSLVARVARLYCNTAPARIAELRAAIGRLDSKGAASAAHALKSMSLNIGAEAVAETAAKIERQARESPSPAEAPEVERLAGLAEETFALLLHHAA